MENGQERVHAFFADVYSWLFHLEQIRCDTRSVYVTVVRELVLPRPLYQQHQMRSLLAGVFEDVNSGHLMWMLMEAPGSTRALHGEICTGRQAVSEYDWMWKKLICEINFIGSFNIMNAAVGIPQGIKRTITECPSAWIDDMRGDDMNGDIMNCNNIPERDKGGAE